DQGPLPDPHEHTSPVRVDGTRVDQGALSPGTRVDQRNLDELEVTPPNEPLPTKPIPKSPTRNFKAPTAEQLDDKPRKKTPDKAPALAEPDTGLSALPTSRNKGPTAAKPRTDPRAASLLEEHTRVGALPEAPGAKPQRIEERSTSMLPEVDAPLDDRPRPRAGPPTGELRIENRETSMLPVPNVPELDGPAKRKPGPPVADDDDDDAVPTALMARPSKAQLDPDGDEDDSAPTALMARPSKAQLNPQDEDPTDATAALPKVDRPGGNIEVRSLAVMNAAASAKPEPAKTAAVPPARRTGYSRIAKEAEKAKADKPGEPPARRPFELSGMIRAEALQKFGQNKNGFQLAIGLVLVVLGLGAFLGYFLHGDKPSNEDLQMAYPYGFSGGRQLNGRSAPPSAEVIFDFEKSVDCGDTVCVRYTAHTFDNSFHIAMDLKKNEKGEWKLVSSTP
ncbi:MAG: hypothetical protein JST54_20730, partial [Deltaproteobacteria bacterium]|nr:hypothetical protein [Deltaproteobacteria bacterium]